MKDKIQYEKPELIVLADDVEATQGKCQPTGVSDFEDCQSGPGANAKCRSGSGVV